MPEIPVEAFQLMHEGFDLTLHEMTDYSRETGNLVPNGRYYAEFTRWGMASTGSQRKREWAGGFGETATAAIADAARNTARAFLDQKVVA